MGALQFDGVNDVVTLPTTMVCATGTTSWIFEFNIAISSYPASGNRYFTGVPTGTTNGGFCLRQASGNGALALVVAGTNVAGFTSPTGYILDDGALHTYRVERDAATGVRFYRDDMVTPVATVSWVTGSNFSLSIGRFGAGSTSAGSSAAFDLGYFDFVSGFSNAQKWDANLSGGTGNILPTVSGSNQGVLVNFPTDNSQWIGFGGTDAIVDLIKTTISTLSKSISIATGASVSVTKSLSTISSKTLQSVADAKVNVVKSSPVVIGKLLVGQTDSSVNASVDLIKSTQTAASKLLVSTADAYVSVQKSQQSVLAKTFGVTAGANVNLSKSVLTVVGKLLIGSTESSIDAVVTISKGSVLIRPVLQNVSADANADVLISKAIVKEYDVQAKSDNFVNIQKGTLLVVGKMLSVGREPSPVGIERIFAIEVDEKIFSVINEQMIFAVEREQTIFTLEK